MTVLPTLVFLLCLIFSVRCYDKITTYNYLDSGDDWKGDCATGREQSPIDIVVDYCEKLEATTLQIEFNNTEVESEEEDLGVTFKAYAKWSTLILKKDGETYHFDAQQFHFHAPSEHRVDGQLFDGEMHIVHQLRAGEHLTRDYAVIGIFFDADESYEDHPFFKNYDPSKEGEFEININNLLGKKLATNPRFYNYNGSLTTPPCTESVNWFILAKPLKISQSQLETFTNAWAKNPAFAEGNGNNRDVQPLNGRDVYIGNIIEPKKPNLRGAVFATLQN